ncbi:hypothetical protein CEXT_682041 [Caerostris extrusa]|uniref:RNase H type-1 domain-containing protein n=1 Tax=Caerostris extrusa TaxID=172846 RepID=A0AAV4UFH7_CAEEX|nr:hypothetical protein CEXT_682041 [Caerostris extrusa]
MLFFLSIYSQLSSPSALPIIVIQQVEETKHGISELNSTVWTIIFQWILSHCDTPGNEKADLLAKHVCSLPPNCFHIPYSQAVFIIVNVTGETSTQSSGERYKVQDLEKPA